MSRSKPNITNPCERWFKWEGGKEKGYLTWYDKKAEKNNIVEKPFTFLVLDQLNTVTGYDSDTKVGFYANEVRNTTKDILTVRTKAGIEAEGLWKEVKGQNKAFDFTKSVYIAFFDDDKILKIGNIKFKGSGLSGLSADAIKENLEEAKVEAKVEAKEKKTDVKNIPLNSYSQALLKSIGWINFSNSHSDLYEIGVVWADVISDQNGSTVFNRPIFKAKTDISPETNAKASALDKQLQLYLAVYFAGREKDVPDITYDDDAEDYITQRNAEIDKFEESTIEDDSKDDDIPF